MNKNAATYTLHRYFIWANRMRIHFDDVLKKGIMSLLSEKPSKEQLEMIMYMSYWYAELYVVIEGWKELKLKDDEINALLESPNVDLLRRYRNGVFHFQVNYYDRRFYDLLEKGQNAAEWVRALNKNFDRFFLEWLARLKQESK